jgi:hypothetical protein
MTARAQDRVETIPGGRMAIAVEEDVIVKSINRAYTLSRTNCLVEFLLDNIDPASKNKVLDTVNFEFAPNSNDQNRNEFSSNPDGKCVWRIVRMTSDDQTFDTSAIPTTFTPQNPGGIRVIPKKDYYHHHAFNTGEEATGKSLKMEILKIGAININANTLKYISPQCPSTIPDVNCTGSNTRNAVNYYYNTFMGGDLPPVVKAVAIDKRSCEFKLDAPGSFEQTHVKVDFMPNSQCSGYMATSVTGVPKDKSLIAGWGRPENPNCYPIDCTKDSLKSMTQAYYKSIPFSFRTGEDSIAIKRTAQVNSNTCEYQITASNGQLIQMQNAAFNPVFHKKVVFKTVGSECETRIASATNVATEAESLTFKQAFSCPTFDPMSLFTGNPRVTSLSLLQSTLRSQFLNTNIFSTSVTPASTFDRVNGPSIRSRDGLTVVRGKLLPADPTSKSLKAEFEIKIFVNLSRPNTETYPFTLSLAKIGTLITQAANQVDWTDYNNQFRVDPKNTWGPRRPPAEFRPEGVYEFSQDMFSTWQPIFHPVIEIQFPTLDCNIPSIRDFTTNNMYSLTLVATKEQSIFV